jgi:F-type H+/Na+-transporting ATPase subunit alpha
MTQPLKITEIGEVVSFDQNTFSVEGLPSVKVGETLICENGSVAVVDSMDLAKKSCILVSGDAPSIGSKVNKTGFQLSFPADSSLMGKISFVSEVFSASTKSKNNLAIDKKSPGIEARSAVKDPLLTGIGMVDLIVPIAYGQRELIIGDRKTGKTQFLRDVVISAANSGNVCIYAMIAKRSVEINETWAYFEKNKIANKICLLASLGTDPAGSVIYTPHLALSLAESEAAKGKNVLVVMDDLSSHAQYYREVSLKLKKFPGRSSYPGDMFYMHAKLMERSGVFKNKNGSESSITCLPVAQSTNSDITGFITTNLMSMTDGHIYFDSNLRDSGHRPAIDPFLSVTRVGHQTHKPSIQDMSRKVTTFMGLYQKSRDFAHFGAEASSSLQQILAKGAILTEMLNQSPGKIVPFQTLVASICLLWAGDLSTLSVDKVPSYMDKVVNASASSEVLPTLNSFIEASKNFEELTSKVHLSEIRRIFTT